MIARGPDIGPIPCILDLLTPRLTAASTRPAVTDSEGSLTYRRTWELAQAVAASLRALGIRPDEPVVVHTRLSRWAIPAMLGVLYAGGHYVPVDRGFPAARQSATIRASGARYAVVEPEDPRTDGSPTVVPLEGGRGGAPPGSPPPRAAGDRPAYCLYTSGSSGTPKGVLISHRALGYSTAARIAYYRQAPTVFLLCSSISFDSSVAGIYWSLATGAHLVVPAAVPLDVQAIAEATARHRASHLVMLPSLYEALLHTADENELSTLRTVIVAGETCPPGLVRRHFAELPGTALYNEYGPTECTVWALVHRCEPADAQSHSVPIGGPIPGTDIHIASDAGPDESGGELSVRSPGVALGHTADSGAESPFGSCEGRPVHRTGDLVRLDERGRAHFVGRSDAQLKLAGMRLEPGEIEHWVREYSGAAEAALAVVDDSRGPARLVAFVVRPGPDFHSADLRKSLLGQLPRAAVPHVVLVIERLPTLPNGKLDRVAVNRLASLHGMSGR